MNGWWGGHLDGWGGLGVGAMVLTGLVLVALAVTSTVLVLRHPGAARTAPVGRHGPGAREMLDERFASGDIDEAEYRWRLGVLAEHP